MLCGHGSRDDQAVTEFAVLSQHLKKRMPQYPVEYGYLEFATPIIRDGLDKLKARGVTRVLAVPGMLFAAGHAKNDIPSVLNTYAANNASGGTVTRSSLPVPLRTATSTRAKSKSLCRRHSAAARSRGLISAGNPSLFVEPPLALRPGVPPPSPVALQYPPPSRTPA